MRTMPRRHVAAAFLAAGLVIAILAGAPARAAVGEVDGTAYSAYLWRGQLRNDEAVLQPLVAVGADWNFHFETWMNLDLTDRNNAAGRVNEIDLTLAFRVPLEPSYGFEVGAVGYHFPLDAKAFTHTTGSGIETSRDTIELFAGFETETFLHPSLYAFWDVDKADGFYFNLGINEQWDLVEEVFWLDLGFSASLANSRYNTFYFGTSQTALNDGNLTLAALYAVSETLTVGAELVYTWLWDGSIREAAKTVYGDDDQFWGGVSATVAF